MLKTRRLLCLFLVDSIVGAVFISLCFFLLPSGHFVFSVVCSVLIFISLQLAGEAVARHLFARLDDKMLREGTTGILSDFILRLRFCYSLEDLFGALGEVLEVRGDCSVLFVDRKANYVIYNSPDRLTCLPKTMEVLRLNFGDMDGEGIYFLDDDFGLTTDYKSARGFFLVSGSHHLYVFCRYTRLFDRVVYGTLFEEYVRFLSRERIISNLTEITQLSREWSMLADVQKAFLPAALPEVRGLELASYFRPLVNVSGDYYTALPLDEHKTLVMVGDVSGKGLAAALVMGLVLNTVKIVEDKEDLAGVVHAIDRAVKGMRLQDKYTVLFIGIIDTGRMSIRYINASMSDPVIVTRAPDGYRIKPLSSNCPLVGIIDLDDVTVAEQRLFRGDLILMASDGVSEAMDKDGVELGATDLYLGTIRGSAGKSAAGFVDDIAGLVLSYSGNNPRDDVTMLVAKVAG